MAEKKNAVNVTILFWSAQAQNHASNYSSPKSKQQQLTIIKEHSFLYKISDRRNR